MRKDTNEIKITRNEYLYCCVICAMSIGLSIILAGYFALSVISSFKIESHKNIAVLGEILIVVISLMVGKWLFTELVSAIRFYGSNLQITDDKLILYTDNKRCEIPLNTDVSVTFCMFGWLIMWHSENKNEVILIRNSLLGVRYLKLAPTFKSKTNYLSSPLKRREILKLFHINRFRPLMYAKWPIF
jgi:hypothetical protein